MFCIFGVSAKPNVSAYLIRNSRKAWERYATCHENCKVKMKTKFRKLFWIRLALGLALFVILILFLINRLLLNPQETKNLTLILVFLALLFLSYLSLDLFKVFSLRVSENGIEITFLITKKKKYIPFNTISSIEKEKITLRNAQGNITDGYYISILKFENERLIISPDSFENYEDLMIEIKTKLNNQHVA